jgi:hypothetical protein
VRARKGTRRLLHRPPDVIRDERAHVSRDGDRRAYLVVGGGACHPFRHVTDRPDRFLGMLLVPLKLRLTGRDSGISKKGSLHFLCGEWNVGRIYETARRSRRFALVLVANR